MTTFSQPLPTFTNLYYPCKYKFRSRSLTAKCLVLLFLFFSACYWLPSKHPMPLLKRCVAIINNRSGHRHSIHAYTETLKQYMDRAGIVHHDIHIPNDDVAEHLRRTLPQAEALVLCGGDGTVNSTVNLLAAMSAPAASPSSSLSPRSLLAETPLLLVPTGLHNSIATSLGVSSAERAVSSLVVGRTVRVPLWAVHLHSSPAPKRSSFSSGAPEAAAAAAEKKPDVSTPSPVRYMCSYIAVGTYASIVQRQAKWKAAQEDYVSLPALLGTLAATSLYTAVEHAAPRCTAQLTTSRNTLHDAVASTVRTGPLRMLVAAQMPQLQAGYSLTPAATYHQHQLCVTTGTSDVTRLRMWHLLRREAREGYVLPEDGVDVQEQVRELRIDFPPAASVGSSTQSAADRGGEDGGEKPIEKKKKESDANGEKEGDDDDDDDAALLVLDGECVRVPHGSFVTVTPTDLTAQFIVS